MRIRNPVDQRLLSLLTYHPYQGIIFTYQQCCGSGFIESWIWIQHFQWIRIRIRMQIQSFDDQKFEKNNWNFCHLFLGSKLQFSYPEASINEVKLGTAALKRENPALQMKSHLVLIRIRIWIGSTVHCVPVFDKSVCLIPNNSTCKDKNPKIDLHPRNRIWNRKNFQHLFWPDRESANFREICR